MEELSVDDMMTLMKQPRGEYSMVEEKVHPEAMVVGKTMRISWGIRRKMKVRLWNHREEKGQSPSPVF